MSLCHSVGSPIRQQQQQQQQQQEQEQEQEQEQQHILQDVIQWRIKDFTAHKAEQRSMPPTASQARHLWPWENDTMQETYVKNKVSNVFGLYNTKIWVKIWQNMSLLISIILLCTLTQICIPFLEALWLVVETDKKRNARQNMCKPLLPRPTQLLSSLTILGLILSACKDSHIFWTTTLYPRFGKFVICDSKTLVRFKERPRKGSVPP